MQAESDDDMEVLHEPVNAKPSPNRNSYEVKPCYSLKERQGSTEGLGACRPKNIKTLPSSSLTEGRGGTEGLKTDTASIEIKEPRPDPVFLGVDVRTQSPGVRSARLAELRRTLHKIGDDLTGRAGARRSAILYKIDILCK